MSGKSSGAMSSKSSGASSRSSSAASNPGGCLVHQAEHAVDREEVSGRLDAIGVSTAENGGRLEKIEDMLGHLQMCWMTFKPTKMPTIRTVIRGSRSVRLSLAVACQTSYG